MKKILAFAGSTSRKSINKQLVTYAAHRLEALGSKGDYHSFETLVLDLNDFEMPLFSVDLEAEQGHPDNAKRLHALIESHDGLMISLAEHNGAYTAAFKNALDWLSRLESKAWDNKPMFLLSTSPGGRGGSSVMEMARNRFKFNGGEVVSWFSLPSFGQNFSVEDGILDADLAAEFVGALERFVEYFVGVG